MVISSRVASKSGAPNYRPQRIWEVSGSLDEALHDQRIHNITGSMMNRSEAKQNQVKKHICLTKENIHYMQLYSRWGSHIAAMLCRYSPLSAHMLNKDRQ